MTIAPQGGTARSHNLLTTAVGYGLEIVDTLGAAGVLTISAVDDSASTFFFRMPYTSTTLNDSTFGWLLGSEGGCEVMLDSSVSGLARGMILSSPYPIIRTGLDENAVQAGDAHFLSLYPSDSLKGTHTLLIRYSDADLGVTIIWSATSLLLLFIGGLIRLPAGRSSEGQLILLTTLYMYPSPRLACIPPLLMISLPMLKMKNTVRFCRINLSYRRTTRTRLIPSQLLSTVCRPGRT